MTASPDRSRATATPLLLAWIGGLVAAIWLLTLAGHGQLGTPSVLSAGAWPEWAAQRDAVTIAFAGLRLLTLLTAWYLLGATLIGAVARLAGWRGLTAVADVLTVPALRRLLQSALGVGLATAALTVGSPSADAPPARTTVATMALVEQQHAPAPSMVPLSGATETMSPAPMPTPAETSERLWRVEPGQHFWSIATEVLTQAWGRPPSDAEVTPYWDELISANRRRLPDPGNPDLLYPGQELTVPAPPRARTSS